MFIKIKKILEKQRRAYRDNLFHKLYQEKIRPDMGAIEREVTLLEIKAIMDTSLQKQYQVAKEILAIASKNELSKAEAYRIVQLFNSANQAPRFSLWLKSSIEHLLKAKNLRYRTSSYNGNIEIMNDHWKLLNPAKLQGIIVNPLIDAERLFFELYKLDWVIKRYVPKLNFELYNEWADLEGTGYDEIVLKGIIVEERFEELVKMVEGIGLKFYLELHKEDQHIKTVSNLAGFS